MENSTPDSLSAPGASSGLGNPERQTRRRLIQSTLFRSEPLEAEEDRDCSTEDELEQESKSKRRRRKAQRRTPQKSPAKRKKQTEAKSKVSPVTAGTDFFLKVSEKKLQQKQRIEQTETVDLTVVDNECERDKEHVAGKRSGQSLKNHDEYSSPSKFRSHNGAEGSLLPPTADHKSNHAKDLSAQNENMPQVAIDLRLEAKIAAEENAHLSAGKQIHPFFSSWKATKRFNDFSDTCELGTKANLVLQSDGIYPNSPIHVIDISKDDLVTLNWNDWEFCDRSVLDSIGCGSEATCLSIFTDSVEPLKIDTFAFSSNYCQPSSQQNQFCCDQLPDVKEANCTESKKDSSTLANGCMALEPLLTYLKMMKQTDRSGLLSGCSGVDSLEDELQCRFFQERMLSYHLRHRSQPNCSLWTNKYQPEASSAVCGNGQSVRSLSNWLQCWRERLPQTSKTSASVDKFDVQDSDGWCQNDSENEDGGTRKNVFLVTGPVGSGKSAAIYACAREHGFHVIEVNSSDWRDGVHVKQKFGEAMESHGFNRWSSEKHVDLLQKHSAELCSIQQDNATPKDFDCEIIKVMPAWKHDFWSSITPSKNATEKRTLSSPEESRSLILFEDVDTVFDEDRGFIASLLQLAETAKRPMILTSNSKDPVLPHLLDRLIMEFSVPSPVELLPELYMACVAEEAIISPQQIERFIRCCHGDIRKTLMLLQFWCQGKRICKSVQEGMKMQCIYSPLQFDPAAGHKVMPKLIPWQFPCQLSLFVEKEISTALMKNNALPKSAVDIPDYTRYCDRLELGQSEKDSVKAKKNTMLRRNCSTGDDTEFLTRFFDEGFCTASGSPVMDAQETVRQKLSTILSSDSEDDKCNTSNLGQQPVRRKLRTVFHSDSEDDECFMNNIAVHTMRQQESTIKTSDLEDDKCCTSLPAMPHIISPDPSEKLLSDIYGRDLNLKIIFPGNLEQSMCQRSPVKSSVIGSALQISDTSKLEVSCVPESSFVPETEINDGAKLLSATVSFNYNDVTLDDVSMSHIKDLSIMEVNTGKASAEASKHLEIGLACNCEGDEESVHGNEEARDCKNVSGEVVTREYWVMDECSRADCSARLIYMESSRQTMPSSLIQEPVLNIEFTDLVQENWRKLRSFSEELRPNVMPEQTVASKIVQVASDLTNLISEADVMLSSCQSLMHDIMEPSMVPCLEPDSASWYDVQLEMTSTYAQHGFCLFMKKVAASGLNLGLENKVDLAQEMLACSISTVAQGKLAMHEMTGVHNCRLEFEATDVNMSFRRELEEKLQNAIFSLVPTTSYLALKGAALHEYLSCLGQISRSEASRLCESNGTGRRRARFARHYLRDGPLALSPEEVILLDQYGHYKR